MIAARRPAPAAVGSARPAQAVGAAVSTAGGREARPSARFGQRGFTLIELMIVVAIIGILAALAIPQYRYAVIKSREAVLRENLFVLRDVIDQYRADKGKLPATLQDLVTSGYLRLIPEDPITGSRETWVPIYEEPAQTDIEIPTEELQEPGIYDVRSGSDKISPIDNTPYSEW